MCVFCDLAARKDLIVWENELVFAVRDRFPVSEGHTLLLPKRHVVTCFEATDAEFAAIGQGLRALREDLDARYHPDGYNVGINNGSAAGQTVPHLHVHLIPRYSGDVDRPRGGVRGVIPDRRDY